MVRDLSSGKTLNFGTKNISPILFLFVTFICSYVLWQEINFFGFIYFEIFQIADHCILLYTMGDNAKKKSKFIKRHRNIRFLRIGPKNITNKLYM